MKNKNMSLISKVKNRYIGALLAMAILLSMAMGVMQYLLYQQSLDAHVINIAGMQRMLSQRIALYSAQDNQRDSEALRQAIDKFESNHEFLTKTESSGEAIYLNEALTALYYQGPVQLDLQSTTFVTLSRSRLQQSTPQLMEQIFTASQHILPNLNDAVSLFEQHARSKTEMVRKIELLIWLLGLLLLFIEAKLVFRPMAREIAEALDKLEAARKLADDALHSKSRFLARVSHELRTPLQAIQGYLDEYLRSKDTQQLQHVKSAANQLDVLLYSVQDFNNLSEQEVVIERHQVALREVIKSACIAFQLTAHKKSLAFNLALSNELDVTCYCDCKRVGWLISELVNNAIKFTERGSIQVFADLVIDEDTPYLEFVVEDTGPGFDYQQLREAVHSEHFQGTQLGLKRCQLLTSALGGRLDFSAREPIGTRAILRVPIEIDNQQVPAHTMEQVSARILLVEDNLLNARVIEKMLQPIAKLVTHVEHGEGALEVYEVGKFDIVLMDLNMPVMDGFEATERLRKLDPAVPILVVTANTNAEDLDKVYALGATAHLYKPLQPDVLHSKVALLLNKCGDLVSS
ncbi:MULTISPECIES: response regulator [unclassified Pseudoalteromonas]|uniref:response regulator n=1 Tax=unclassified Pseudoalteromonas TaxID=194690 RepID=UPI001F3EB71A|nr:MULTISPECIES: response regulator [unclassified Pseudoalteromonas]MCF2828854.1 response regulator [Pseudoalteromonas sp. OF5H-5]MCF2832213.1 response regulator [Pseudoalteromonas sp. DL2-H6]MCF2925774.1 response regulator [Pseudoalteromonas sp. DL2-H1]